MGSKQKSKIKENMTRIKKVMLIAKESKIGIIDEVKNRHGIVER